MMKLEWKNARFLRSFISIALILFIIMGAVLIAVYNMSMGALEWELRELNRKDAQDYRNRFEEVISQCNLLAGSLISESTVQSFFFLEEPTKLYADFYSKLQGRTTAYGLRCVDSVILYAPKYDRVYNPSYSSNPYTASQLTQMSNPVDLSWLELIEEADGITTSLHIRAKADTWPYYITLIKQNNIGVVVVNIDLRVLYEQLVLSDDAQIQLYGVDDQGQVFLRDQKDELTLDVSQVEQLSYYQSGAELSILDRKLGIAYAQSVSEKYGYTMVTVNQLDNYFQSLSRIHMMFALWGTGTLILVIVLALLYSARLVRPIHTIQQVLKSPMDWTNEKKRHSREVREIADEIVRNLQFNSQLQDELSERLDLLNRTQMLALQAQINPHFLFNTLNMICLMVERDNGDEYLGSQMIRSLSDILRYSLADRKLTTLREEMEYAGKYLSILRQRYKTFEYTLKAEEGLKDCLIPKLVLQPLLENAIQHGISGSRQNHKGVLLLCIRELSYTYETGKTLPSVCIELTDNGAGIPPQRLEEVRRSIHDYSDISTDHIGLANVAQRFYLCFREEQAFQVESGEGKGTCIRICFPKIMDPDAMEQ